MRRLTLPDRSDLPFVVAFVVALGFACWGAVRYVHQPIVEHHGFRQTQTAITAYWWVRNGPSLAYETPVLGEPWSIPFELPIYQAIVATVHQATDLDLQATGRMISFVFLLGCAFQLAGLVRALGFPARGGWIAGALLLSAQQYLFWGRTFLIETAALFFTLAATRHFTAYLAGGRRALHLALFSLFLALALLQKVTTALPVVALLGLVWLVDLARTRRFAVATVFEGLAFLAPALLAGAWIRYTDVVKSKNDFGAWLVSDALRNWSFGTLEQRLSKHLWVTTAFERQWVGNLGGLLGVALVVWALAWGPRRVRFLVAGGLALFFGHLLTFPNLHIIHDYYQTAVTVWLVFAGTISILPILERPDARRLGIVLFLALVGSNLVAFRKGYYAQMTWDIQTAKNRTLAVGRTIAGATPEGSTILVVGYAWSSEIPFFAERKAIGILPWPGDRFKGDVLSLLAERAEFAGDRLGAVALCPNPPGTWRPPPVGPILAALGEDRFHVVELQECTVLLRNPPEPPGRFGAPAA